MRGSDISARAGTPASEDLFADTEICKYHVE